jgi:hypothetical protein
MLCVANCDALTGYYFGVKGGVAKKRVSLNFPEKAKSYLNKEYKSTKFSGQAVSGYVYGLPNIFGLGGQVFVGYAPRDIHIKESWTYQAPKGEYSMTSDLSFKDRLSFGFDALVGVNVGKSFIFATCGVCVQKPKIHGTIIGELNQEKIGTHFGAAGLTVDKISFPEVKSPVILVPSWTIGGGFRCFFLEKLFLGVECKYFLSKNKDLKLRYTAYDPDGVMGIATGNSVSERKDKKDRALVPAKLKNIEVGFIVGFRL